MTLTRVLSLALLGLFSLTAQAQTPAVGEVANQSCDELVDIPLSEGEVYAVKLKGARPERDDWMMWLYGKGGPGVGMSERDVAEAAWQVVGGNFTRPEHPLDVIAVSVTLPDGRLALDAMTLESGFAFMERVQSVRVGENSPTALITAGIELPDGPGSYPAELGSGPEEFPRVAGDGFELAFALPPQLLNEDLGGCTLGAEIASPLGDGSFLIGFNLYRMEDDGLQPTPDEIAAQENWLDFAPFDRSLARTNLLSSIVDPDGIGHSGDEVLMYHDAPFTPDGSPRPNGTAPDTSGATAYWYAVAPVFDGELSEWADLGLAKGPPRDHRVDRNGDGVFDAIEVDPATADGPEFVSPQAVLGWDGLGLTSRGRALVSRLVRAGDGPTCWVRARGALSASEACIGDLVVLEGGTTTASCPDLEYRFELTTGEILRDWSPDPVAAWVPDEEGGFAVRLLARCESEPDCDRETNLGSVEVRVDTEPPAFAGVVDAIDRGHCEVEVVWDESTAIDDCGGPLSFNLYRDHGIGNRGETLVASGLTGSSYIDTTPGNGTWVYVVRAVDFAGNEEQNEVFVQESENSCTNDFPEDAGMSDDYGVDPPNGDGGAPPPDRRGFGERIVLSPASERHGDGQLRISWDPSPSEEGLHRISYSVLRGSLAALWEGRYDHQLADASACGIEAHEYLTEDAGPSASYWIVVPVGGDNATFGYDSGGEERPEAPVCF